MPSSIRIYIARFLSLFLAFYILNFSLAILPCPAGYSDLPAHQTDNAAESVNLLELILEISIEGDAHNTFPEPIENQQEIEKEPESPDLFSFGSLAMLAPYITGLESPDHNNLISILLSLMLEVCSPPPKF